MTCREDGCSDAALADWVFTALILLTGRLSTWTSEENGPDGNKSGYSFRQNLTEEHRGYAQ